GVQLTGDGVRVLQALQPTRLRAQHPEVIRGHGDDVRHECHHHAVAVAVLEERLHPLDGARRIDCAPRSGDPALVQPQLAHVPRSLAHFKSHERPEAVTEQVHRLARAPPHSYTIVQPALRTVTHAVAATPPSPAVLPPDRTA